MAELTIEALQHFMIENGCKVKSSDAIDFFRLNFAQGKISDLTDNKELFKKYMEQLTRAEITENGERYLVLKRQHMVPVSPHSFSSPRNGRHSRHTSPRYLRPERSQPRITSPRNTTRGNNFSIPLPISAPSSLQQCSPSPASASLPVSAPGSLLAGVSPQDSLEVPLVNMPSLSNDELSEQEDGVRSPISGYDSDEFDEDDQFEKMELGSVGGCSNNQLEPCQKEWIYKAAIGDMESVSRLLLQDKSLVKYKDFISGYTGLHWAVKLGRADMVHVLLACESDINSRAYNGMTPLHLAAQCGHEHIIDILIKEKADKLVRDYNGKYPLFYLSSRTPERLKEILSPPLPPSQKPRHHTTTSEKASFTLRRTHKREKSDGSGVEMRSKTLNNNFKYQALNKNSHKRPLSGLKIDHVTFTDGSGDGSGAKMVKSKEEALESVCSVNSNISPRSVKRVSLGTPLLLDLEPLLTSEDGYEGNKLVEYVPDNKLEEVEGIRKYSCLLCCCPSPSIKKRNNSSV